MKFFEWLKQKKYLYFNNGRGYYNGESYILEKCPISKIPEKHLNFFIEDVDSSNYPKKIMNYLSSILLEEQIGPFTFFLSQIIGGKVYLPIYLVGEPHTGKTALMIMLKEIFEPIVNFENWETTRFHLKEKWNRCLYLNNKPFIIELNKYPKYKGCTIYDFKNRFDEKNTILHNDLLTPLRPEYPYFVLYLISRYEDYMFSREEGWFET